ncbi:hypothetical protein [Streptomyces purpureus]|nr:hypothetical protein [Streptomyces purpureus]
MTADPTEPETFQENGTDTLVELGEETPEADAAEQHTDVQQQEDDRAHRPDPASANEADAAEQTRVVALDEDDYR